MSEIDNAVISNTSNKSTQGSVMVVKKDDRSSLGKVKNLEGHQKLLERTSVIGAGC